MTTTLREPTKPALNGRARTATRPRQQRPPDPLRRNRGRIALGLVVIALSVLGVVSVVSRGAERQSVLALAHDVPAGTIIEPSDLTAVELPVDTGLPVVSADEVDQLIGQRAKVTLISGTLLHPNLVSTEARVPDGMVLLGAVLDPGQYPVDLRPGDDVQLIELPPPAASSSEVDSTNLGAGEVRQIAEPPTGASALVVSLLVPASSADAIAAAGAEGRISLVVVGER